MQGSWWVVGVYPEGKDPDSFLLQSKLHFAGSVFLLFTVRPSVSPFFRIYPAPNFVLHFKVPRNPSSSSFLSSSVVESMESLLLSLPVSVLRPLHSWNGLQLLKKSLFSSLSLSPCAPPAPSFPLLMLSMSLPLSVCVWIQLRLFCFLNWY